MQIDRNTRTHFRNRQGLVWIAVGYSALIAIVLYPALHEELSLPGRERTHAPSDVDGAIKAL
jgi:hypothetical protein